MAADEVTLSLNDTLNKFKDAEGQYFKSPKYANAIEELKKEINEIKVLYKGLSNSYETGELLVMISRQFGFYTFEKIPHGRVNEIKTWVRQNWYRSFELLSSDEHKKLMEYDNPYKSWYLAEHKKHNPELPEYLNK